MANNERPRRVSLAWILGIGNKPFKDDPPTPPRQTLKGMLTTPGAPIEWAASDGRKGRLTGKGRPRLKTALDAAALAKVPSRPITVAEAAKKHARPEDAKNASKEASNETGKEASSETSNKANDSGQLDYKHDAPNPEGFTEDQDKTIMRMKNEDASAQWAVIAEKVGKPVWNCKERFKQIKPDGWLPPNVKGKGNNKGGGQGGKQGKGKNQNQNQNQNKEEQKTAEKEEKKEENASGEDNAWGGGGFDLFGESGGDAAWDTNKDGDGNNNGDSGAAGGTTNTWGDSGGNNQSGGGFNADENKGKEDDNKNDSGDNGWGAADSGAGNDTTDNAWNTDENNNDAAGVTTNTWGDTGNAGWNTEETNNDAAGGTTNTWGDTGNGGWNTEETKDGNKSNEKDKDKDKDKDNNGWGAPKSPTKPPSKAPSKNAEKHHSGKHSSRRDSDPKKHKEGSATGSSHRHSSSRPAEYKVAPDDTFSQHDLKLVARILQQDCSMVWERVSWRFRDKTGRNLHPDVFEKKITGKVEKERKH